MNNNMLLLFMIAFSLFAMQAIGGIFQIKNYRVAMRRLHKKGNVGVGQKKGRFFNGHIVMISCDANRMITGCEVLDGMTFLSKFRSVNILLEKELLGSSIDEYLDEFRQMSKKQKKYKGYINALEALEMRFNNA